MTQSENRFLLLMAFLLMTVTIIVFAADKKVFYVEDCRAVGVDSNDSKAIQKAIDKAIEAGPGSVVQLQKRKYRISAPNLQPCLIIDQADELIIQGQGEDTELVVTNPKASVIHLMNCENVVIKSLAIDYNPLPFTQGRIVGVNAEEGTFDLDIEKGFSVLDEPWFVEKINYGMIFDPSKPLLKTNAPDHIFIDSWQNIKGRSYRLKSTPGYKSKVAYMDAGDRFVYLARLAVLGCIHFSHCKDSGLENVQMYAGNSGAVVTVSSDKLFFKKFEVIRRPNTNRLLSSDADGIHCSQSRIGPLIEDCVFENIGDDSLNIYAPVNRIIEISNSDELILSKHGLLQQGDQLQIYNSSEGIVLAERTVKTVEELPDQRYRVKLNRPAVEVYAGTGSLSADAVFNLSASGRGYIIRNNRMIGQRRHGIMVRGGEGIIENNYIRDVGGLGIVLANDPDWPEGPIPGNIIIRNNTLIHAGNTSGYAHRKDSGAIQLINMRAGYELGKGRDVKNIVIEGNRIIDPVTAAIFVGGARDIKILNNEVTASGNVSLYEKSAAVKLMNCENVEIDGLKLEDYRSNRIAAIEVNNDVVPGAKGVAIKNLHIKIQDEAVEVLDKR